MKGLLPQRGAPLAPEQSGVCPRSLGGRVTGNVLLPSTLMCSDSSILSILETGEGWQWELRSHFTDDVIQVALRDADGKSWSRDLTPRVPDSRTGDWSRVKARVQVKLALYF